jgi:hypothetical protein
MASYQPTWLRHLMEMRGYKVVSPPEWGGFKVLHRGIEVAGGSGPYEAIKAESARRAALYWQDGPVEVRVWKYRRKASAP